MSGRNGLRPTNLIINSLHSYRRIPAYSVGLALIRYMSTTEEKKKLRQLILHERDQLDMNVKYLLDEHLIEKLKAAIAAKKVHVLHTYLPMGSEINLFPLIQFLLDSGITVVAPQSLPKRNLRNLVLRSLNDLEPGIYGTSHPKNSEEYFGTYDMILVPGLAFDNKGYRLGYGAGYYDKFLADHTIAWKVGACYPFQVIEKIPREAHDIQLDEIIF